MEFGSRPGLAGFALSRGMGLVLASLSLPMPVIACGSSSRGSTWRRDLPQGRRE